MKSTTLFNVDLLNIFLILVSGILAFLFPLELFLFSFILLGPLHYLTEINWLHEKKYFFNSDKKYWLSICLLAVLGLFLPKFYFYLNLNLKELDRWMSVLNEWSNSFIILCIMLAVMQPYIKTLKKRVLFVLMFILASIFCKWSSDFSVFIGLLIPTVIHVFLFTIFFMIYGVKKSKSLYGIVAVILVCVSPLCFSFISIEEGDYVYRNFFKELYLENNFHHTPVFLNKTLGLSDGTSFYFYEILWIKTMMFISFAYCYHYLNWFSKTTTIKWHKDFDKKKIITLIIFYSVTLLIYFIDIELGFLISLFFGFLHVFLEFPLNVKSIRSMILKE